MTGSNRPDTLAEVIAAMRPEPVAGTPGRYPLCTDDAEGLLTALGLLDPSRKAEDPEVEIQVSPDGALAVVDASYGASVQPGTIADWGLVLTFDAAPTIGPMQEPDDLRVVFDPGRVYRLVLPDDWDTEVDTNEEFTDFHDAPDGSVEVVAYCAKDTGLDLATWTQDGIDFYTEEWGSAPSEQPRSATLGGQPATITAWSTAEVSGTPSFAINIAVIHGDRSCDQQWLSDPGNEQATAELFGAFVAGFSWSE